MGIHIQQQLARLIFTTLQFGQGLMEMDILSREVIFFIYFASLLKGIYSKMKEFAPIWSKFFPFRVDHFSEGICCAGKQIGSHKSCFLVNSGKKLQEVFIHLKKRRLTRSV